jgi:glycosyltransferase involved in cell wall biosynthesis
VTTSIRVCCATTSYPRSEADEAGIFVERLVTAMVQTGLKCSVVVPVDNDEPLRERRGEVDIQRFPYGLFGRGRLAFGKGIGPNVRANPILLLQLPLLVSRFALEIRRLARDVDVVHANWLLAGCAAYVARKLGGSPYVVTCRGEDLKLLRLPVLSLIVNTVLRRAELVTTVSEQFRAEVMSQIPELSNRIVCIPNGVRGPSNKELSSLPPKSKELLYVGRIIPLKRLEWALQLLSCPALSEYTLTLCGRSEDREYREQLEREAQNRGVFDRITFVGVVPPAEVRAYLIRARYLLNFSDYEGRPNSVLEGLAYGVVVLVSDIPAHRELVESSRNGWICRDARDAASAVERLDANLEEYSKVSAQARISVEPYTWGAAAQAYRRVFEQALHAGNNILQR